MRILLLQELVDAVQIVEGVVDEEAKFGDDAQLVVYTLSQFVADGLLVGIDVLQQLFPLFRREYAEIRRADAEVGAYLHTCDTDQYAVHHACLRLEDARQLLLEEACYAVLSCFLHNSLFYGFCRAKVLNV